MSLKKKSIFGILAAGGLILTIAIIGKSTLTGPKAFTVKKTKFESIITAKGEIQGRNAVLIYFPDEMKHRDLRIHEFQIKDLIEEGSLVKKGDWVASLDKDNINQQIQYNNDEMERRLADGKIIVPVSSQRIDKSTSCSFLVVTGQVQFGNIYLTNEKPLLCNVIPQLCNGIGFSPA